MTTFRGGWRDPVATGAPSIATTPAPAPQQPAPITGQRCLPVAGPEGLATKSFHGARTQLGMPAWAPAGAADAPASAVRENAGPQRAERVSTPLPERVATRTAERIASPLVERVATLASGRIPLLEHCARVEPPAQPRVKHGAPPHVERVTSPEHSARAGRLAAPPAEGTLTQAARVERGERVAPARRGPPPLPPHLAVPKVIVASTPLLPDTVPARRLQLLDATDEIDTDELLPEHLRSPLAPRERDRMAPPLATGARERRARRAAAAPRGPRGLRGLLARALVRLLSLLAPSLQPQPWPASEARARRSPSRR